MSAWRLFEGRSDSLDQQSLELGLQAYRADRRRAEIAFSAGLFTNGSLRLTWVNLRTRTTY